MFYWSFFFSKIVWWMPIAFRFLMCCSGCHEIFYDKNRRNVSMQSVKRLYYENRYKGNWMFKFYVDNWRVFTLHWYPKNRKYQDRHNRMEKRKTFRGWSSLSGSSESDIFHIFIRHANILNELNKLHVQIKRLSIFSELFTHILNFW